MIIKKKQSHFVVQVRKKVLSGARVGFGKTGWHLVYLAICQKIT